MYRKNGRALPLGHKPRGRQRVAHNPNVRNGPTAQQSVLGTETVVTPGVFSSAAGGTGLRTFTPPPLARAPVQPFTFGFFTPFALGGALFQRTRAEVPFQAPASTTPQAAPVMPAPSAPKAPATPVRSTVFPVPR